MTSDLSGAGCAPNERKRSSIVDTPLNRGGQSAPTKPHRLVHGTEDAAGIQDSVQAKPELGHPDLVGHPTPGQVKSELEHLTPPSVPGQAKVSAASSEEARKLRQVQQRLRQEQWKKRNVGVAAVGVAPGLGSIPDSDQIEMMKKSEVELMSNGNSFFHNS